MRLGASSSSPRTMQRESILIGCLQWGDLWKTDALTHSCPKRANEDLSSFQSCALPSIVKLCVWGGVWGEARGTVEWELILNLNGFGLVWGALDNGSLPGSTLPPVTMAPRHFNRKAKKTHFWAALTSIALSRSVAILNRLLHTDPLPDLVKFSQFQTQLRHCKATWRDPWKEQ